MAQPQQWATYYFFSYTDLKTAQDSCNFGQAAYGLKFVSLTHSMGWRTVPGRWEDRYLLVMGTGVL
jgi:hypothetical protein